MLANRLGLVLLMALATASGLYALAFLAQGRVPAGLLALAVATGSGFLTARGMTARARSRRERDAARERAFLEALRRR